MTTVTDELVSLDGDELRAAVETWLREHVPNPGAMDRAEMLETVGRAGLLFPRWPRRYHGLDASPAQSKVISDALVAHGVQRNFDFAGQFLLGPVLLEWGTEEQKARWLPEVALGQKEWCQLFSEPGAGSDLAGLACRAVRDGDSWVVNGQKVWTSGGMTADYGMLIARTDPDLPKHDGITFFAMDMTAPGVERRPLIQITGETTFAEVFMTDVLVPDENRIGGERDGWRVSRTTLASERSSLSGPPGVGNGLTDALVKRARKTGQWDDPAVRDQIMRLVSKERALQMTNLRRFVANKAGKPPGPEGSVAKLMQSSLGQEVSALSVHLDGPGGQAWASGDGKAEWRNYGFLSSRAATILGGTSEIQRNIIGERVLGLPREPGFPPDTPWKDIPRSV